MKLAELIQAHDLNVKAEAALKSVDWNFDVDGSNESRFSRGAKAMKEAEDALSALYRTTPDDATALWEKYCPYAAPGSLPVWALRK